MQENGEKWFWTRVHTSGECWEWTGGRNADGYGKCQINGKTLLAHRVAWSLAHGQDPGHNVVLHLCDNPACVRPDHLRLGTQADNVRDMFSKRRNVNVSGDEHPAAKLTRSQVAQIRTRYANGEGQRALAREYGVSHTNIQHIVNGRSWTTLDRDAQRNLKESSP